MVRLLFERGLAAIYCIAFISALNQFPALLGERGLLPVRDFLERVRFRDAPSIFHWRYFDALLKTVAWIGIVLSAITVAGVTEMLPVAASVAIWLVMWALYLSIVNVGQTFYAFGWESMLCEAGFFAAFLGSHSVPVPVITIVALRWMLFRTELGAGLIKLRHDACWRNLTCLYYHYETQPLPNPISRLFHRFPKPMHRFSVAFSHFVQVVAPFGLFAPQPIASIAAALAISQQLLLIVSGNYAWLNWLTVVLGIVGFGHLTPITYATPWDWIVIALGVFTIALSIQPALNFFSPNQAMNYCWNRFHLVCAYGAFGSITKERYEVVIEGSDDGVAWKEYEFRAKPGDPARRPPQVAPYHLRLDWLMWFLPFSVHVIPGRVLVPGYELWFIRFVQNLLQNDPQTLSLIRVNPFPDAPPKYLRAGYYRYHFGEGKTWWTRERVGEYLPAIALNV